MPRTSVNSDTDPTDAHPLILYDGVCGLCNKLNQFVLRRDTAGLFRFAQQQSQFAAHILKGSSTHQPQLETVYVVLNRGEAEERLLARSDAVLFVLNQLGGFWRIAATLLQLLPRPLRDWGYRLVARNRYRVFGRFDACPLPSADHRSRFLDL